MNYLFGVLLLALGGVNAFVSILNFMDGHIGMGVFNGTVALFVYTSALMTYFRGGNQ